ncbi:MAG TPA: riboflavin synthase [Solirubrobacteraceae bacterium]
MIADLGRVSALERNGAGATLEIETRLASELKLGDSIAVNGVCLTVSETRAESFRAQAMIETLARSSLGELELGAQVNLELALRAQDRLGGHIVQGHVDGTGTVGGTREEGFARVLTIETDGRLERYLVEKGSVALDGVSLTVSALEPGGFEVALIPETLARTSLGEAVPGRRVNIEVDVLAKHVERLMHDRNSKEWTA